MGKKRRRAKKTVEHPKDRPFPPGAGTMLGMEGEACLDLFPQSITVYCSCQREREEGSRGSPVRDTTGGNSLNQETGKERGGKTREKCAGGSVDWERQTVLRALKLKNKCPKRHYF